MYVEEKYSHPFRVKEAAEYMRRHLRHMYRGGRKKEIKMGLLLYTVAKDFGLTTKELREELGWNKKKKQVIKKRTKPIVRRPLRAQQELPF